MQLFTASRLRHTMHFLLAHTLASAISLGIFLIPLLAPYAAYVSYINWTEISPYLKPYAVGLGVSIWFLAIIPALIVHKVIRMARLYNKQDYILIGAAAGLALSLPVLKLMGTDIINTAVTPVITPAWLLANQVFYAVAWAFSGAAFGFCYYFLHSERY
ncbi:MAG: hypothetical protein EON60_08115 [Alphaproteobacteria bacterium]|nr:MAG: hypothetical protein EON60_08115 [Alphaproteobacteria bacterium]